MVGGAIILGTAGYLMASSIRDTGMFWLTPTELWARVADDSEFASRRGVKIEAQVVPGSIVRADNGRDLSFLATDGGKVLRVIYNKPPPDTFSDSASVILTGRLRSDSTFVATELLAKCASRFEAAPPGTAPKTDYRNSAGYKEARKGVQ
jgi:cytochrome c-type biogenesis protein CcmE